VPDPVDAAWMHTGEIAAGIADGICVIAPDGLVAWVNDAMADLMETTRAELLGLNGLELLHPDDLARAIDGLDYAQQFPGRTAVAPFRIMTLAGGVRDVDIKTGILSLDGHDYVTVVVRDASARRAVNRALRSVAQGAPLSETVTMVADAIMGRWPNTGIAVVLPDGPDGRKVHLHRLEGPLADHANGLNGFDGHSPPWELARGAQPVKVVDGRKLPDELRHAALEQGYAGFGVAPIRVANGGEGCLLVWFDHTVIARLEFFHAAPELTEILTIAVDRHNLHLDMWWAARRDTLTGLFNRLGFTEQFHELVDSARSSPDRVAVVFFVDLDGLKGINDRDGHAAGDAALKELARRLDRVDRSALTARLGGDEFALAITVAVDDADRSAERLGDRILTAIADGPEDHLHASVGLAIDDGLGRPEHLLERADVAMYRAKHLGPARWSR